MKRTIFLLCIILVLTPYLLHSQILVNSGFEDSLSLWEPRLANGGNASFLIITDDPKEGAMALKIVVTGSGTSDTAVSVAHSPVSLNAGELYLIRFWARSTQGNARFRLDIKSVAGTDYCDFKLRNEWYQYQYAFKAEGSQISIAFNMKTFTSYWVDGFELYNQDDECIDVPMTYMWQNNLGEWGWISGDNDPSVLLPDGRSAWIFNDSWLGTPDQHSNSLDVKGMYNNMIVVQDGVKRDSLWTIYGGTKQDPTALLIPKTPDTHYWIADGTVEDNKLKVLLQEWEGGPDGWPIFRSKAAVAILSLPDLSVDTIIELPYDRSDIPNCILEGDSAYNYIYTVERVDSWEWYTRVARVPKGEFESTAEWEFYTTEDTWASGEVTPKRLATVEPGSVIKLDYDNFALVGIPQLSNRIELWFASSPEGPWGNKTTVYKIPGEPDIYSYLPHIHKETGNNGVYTISHSVNTFDGIGHQIDDKGTYIPYYVKVDMIMASEGKYPPILIPFIVYEGNTTERSAIVVREGDDLKLSPRSMVDPGTWSWTGPNGFTYDSRRVDLYSIEMEEGGQYTVTFTDTNNNTASLIMEVIVTRVETNSEGRLSKQEMIGLYPNPASDMLYIRSVGQLKVSLIEIFDLTGKKVIETEHSEVDVKSLQRGTYLVRVHYHGKQFNRIFIKI